MPLTITKPAVGSNGWGPKMNNNLDSIKSAVDANEQNIGVHSNSTGIKHTSQQISHDGVPLYDTIGSFVVKNTPITPGTKTKITYDAKGFVTGGTNLIVGDIPDLPISKITGLNDIINMVLVDMQSVSISASIRNTNGGIRVSCSTVPAVHVMSWRVIMEWKGSKFYDVYTSSSESFINMDNYPEITDGSMVDITVEAISGQTSNASRYSHKYQYVATPIDLRVTAVEHELAPQALMDRIAQDDNVLNELVNRLQHSGTLIQRLSEVLDR